LFAIEDSVSSIPYLFSRLYIAHYNLCRVHESRRAMPAVAQGIPDHVCSIGELIDAALATPPIDPVVTRRLR